MSIARYFHTLRYLRPTQISQRVWLRGYRPKPDLRPAPPRRTSSGRWQNWSWRPALMQAPTTVRLLNVTGRVERPADWDDPSQTKLWRYNLHYFDDLNADNSAAREPWHRALVARWIRDNPPGVGTGWDPYPTSLRIVNWIKWALAAESGREPRLDASALSSLATQARWLRRRLETHLLGNHLFANAKALAAAGMFCEGPEAQRWLETALPLLDRELNEQILADGGHFERSPMYHAIVLEDVLDLINLSRAFPACLSPGLVAKLIAVTTEMLHWLRVMTHPDGQISFFNDAAFGVAPTHAALVEYAQQLELHIDVKPLRPIEALSASGYVRLQNDRAVLICDVAPVGPDYLPAHAHADTLSFELSLDGHRLVVNSGTSTYAPGLERERQRSTAAHNSVVIDRESSSEVWGSFRVARRARPLAVACGSTGTTLWAEASHDGYERLPGRVIHRRRWTLTEDSLRIDDNLLGRFETARAFWHWHPDVAVSVCDESGVRVVCVQSPGGRTARLSSDPMILTDPEPSTWHPEFERTVSSRMLSIPFEGSALVTRLQW